MDILQDEAWQAYFTMSQDEVNAHVATHGTCVMCGCKLSLGNEADDGLCTICSNGKAVVQRTERFVHRVK